MRINSFRTARMRVAGSVRYIGLGALMLGLGISASARDAAPVVDSVPMNTKTAPSKPGLKIAAKTRKWLEVGVASWYGLQFQGRKTAGGEAFDMNGMTCAHRTLPMGTWLRVTNLKNRKTAFVRVNDRGPVLDDRIVDLSFAAAKSLGLAGMGKVKLEAVRANDPELMNALIAQVQMPVLFGTLGR